MSRIVHSLRMAWVLVCSMGGLNFISAAPFQPPLNITQGEGNGTRTQLSRNPQGSLVYLGNEHLALVYFEGAEATTTHTPSSIWLREWRNSGGWSARQRVDHSVTPGGAPIGGRHPVAARRADESLFIAWHDHRHSNAAQNWIN